MAYNLQGDFFERQRRVDIVGNLFLGDEFLSTRKIADKISKDDTYGFKISNVTVADYIERYKKSHPERKEEIDSLIDAHTPKSFEDPEIIKRVYKAAELILSGETIESASIILHTGYWTINRDLNVRLRKLEKGKGLYLDVKAVLEEHARNHATR